MVETLTVTLSEYPAYLAVIVAEPALFPVTVPPETVATVVLDDDQVAEEVTSFAEVRVPLVYVMYDAVADVFSPTLIDEFDMLTSRLWVTASLTVTVADAVYPLYVAFIADVPDDFPVMVPPETVATVVLPLLHEADDVTSLLDDLTPSAYVIYVAVAVVVSPTLIDESASFTSSA